MRAPSLLTRGSPKGRANPRRHAVLMLLALTLALIGSKVHAERVVVGGTGGGVGIAKLLAAGFAQHASGIEVEVLPSLGSSGGIRALTAGDVQLAISGRPLKPKEQAQGIELVEFARTPFVFVLSQDNVVDAISLPALIEMYAGRNTHWPDGEKIRVVLRLRSDSDTALLRGVSPPMAAALALADERPGMQYAITDQNNLDMIEAIPGALGATTLGQLLAEGRHLKALTLDGVAPNVNTLKEGRYPLSKSLYLGIGPASTEATHKFVEFISSTDGQSILERHGYWVP